MEQANAVRAVIHAAIFTTTDADALTSLLVIGSTEVVDANTPAGGCWREVPAGIALAEDVPPLGELS